MRRTVRTQVEHTGDLDVRLAPRPADRVGLIDLCRSALYDNPRVGTITTSRPSMSTSIPIGSPYVGTGGVASCSSVAPATSATAAKRVAAARTSGSEPSSGGAQGRSGDSSGPMVRSPMYRTMQCSVGSVSGGVCRAAAGCGDEGLRVLSVAYIVR